jgi:hypothetical protein
MEHPPNSDPPATALATTAPRVSHDFRGAFTTIVFYYRRVYSHPVFLHPYSQLTTEAERNAEIANTELLAIGVDISAINFQRWSNVAKSLTGFGTDEKLIRLAALDTKEFMLPTPTVNPVPPKTNHARRVCARPAAVVVRAEQTPAPAAERITRDVITEIISAGPDVLKLTPVDVERLRAEIDQSRAELIRIADIRRALSASPDEKFLASYEEAKLVPIRELPPDFADFEHIRAINVDTMTRKVRDDVLKHLYQYHIAQHAAQFIRENKSKYEVRPEQIRLELLHIIPNWTLENSDAILAAYSAARVARIADHERLIAAYSKLPPI